MTGTTTELGGWRALSCYTANLAAYLERQTSTAAAADRMARSARLAVRDWGSDGPAFSQHGIPLQQIDADRQLRFVGAQTREQARRCLLEEAGRGDLLVLAHSAFMPWSRMPRERNGPHLVLVEGGAGTDDRWPVTDHFVSRLPTGDRQDAWTGTVSGDQLLDMMSAGGPFSRQQELRNTLMFGSPVEVPQAPWRWLAPRPGRAPRQALAAGWTADPAAVWEILGRRIDDDLSAGAEPEILDDIWAAAQHHRHRCHVLADSGLVEHELLTRAEGAWHDLPRTLRLATQSARRGSPRPGLVRTATQRLVDHEVLLQQRLEHLGWSAETARAEERE